MQTWWWMIGQKHGWQIVLEPTLQRYVIVKLSNICVSKIYAQHLCMALGITSCCYCGALAKKKTLCVAVTMYNALYTMTATQYYIRYMHIYIYLA